MPRNKLRFMWYGAEEFGLLGSTSTSTSCPRPSGTRSWRWSTSTWSARPTTCASSTTATTRPSRSGPGAAAGTSGLRVLENAVHRLLQRAGAGQRPDAVQRPLGLRAVHRGRHPGRRPVHRRRGRSRPPRRRRPTAARRGSQYDPCYHLACDTYANNSNTGLDQMSDAAAHVVLTLSRVKVDVRQTEAVSRAPDLRQSRVRRPGPSRGADER